MEENFKNKLLKIVLFGPESTGKTTLAKKLAEYYNTVWVPEYARVYLQNKWNTNKEKCSFDDLTIIAEKQLEKQKELEKKANKIIFCDTNYLVTKLWGESYFNKYPAIINDIAQKEKYDLYLLTGIDVPWEPDDLRDNPDKRHEEFNQFKTELQKNNIDYMNIYGTLEERLKKCVLKINTLLS